MKKNSIVITALLLVLTLRAGAQDAKDASATISGWLWEVSGNGLQQKSHCCTASEMGFCYSLY